MEEYFRSLIEKCKSGKMNANDLLKRVEKSDFVDTAKPKKTWIPKPKKTLPKTSIEDLPSSLNSLSTKATEHELPGSQLICSLTTLEDRAEKSMFEKQVDLRKNLLLQSTDGLDLQKYIEEQLCKITETLGPIQDKDQLEDIKRKCRLKWMLRMKQIQRERVRKEEEEFKSNCSFKPKINESEVSSRYMEPQSFRSNESITSDFTFTPRLNKKSISILRSSAKYNKNAGAGGHRESSMESNRGSVQTDSMAFKSIRSEGPTIPVTNRLKSRASITNGIPSIDEDFNDLMQNLHSVRPFPKEQSPNMYIEDLLQPQQEENRVEKVLDFNGYMENSAKKQSLGIYRNYLTQMTETTSRNVTLPSARTNKNEKGTPKAPQKRAVATPKSKLIRSESVTKGINKENSRILRGSVTASNNKENYSKCKHGGVTESAQKAMPKEARGKWFEEFFNRNQQFKEEKSKRLDKVNRDVSQDHSFQPKISKGVNNEEPKKWSYQEKVNKVLKDKEEWLAKRREEKAAKELEGVTHQPNINKKIAASSKLNTNLPTGLYIEKLKEQEQIEKDYVNLMKRRQLILETAECTYRPQINENPFQLRKILSPQSSKALSSSTSTNNTNSSSYKSLHSKRIPTVTTALSQRANTKLFYNYHQKENQNNTTVPGLFDNISVIDDDYYYC